MAKNDRLRIPVEPDYLHALGEATYAFSRLEWTAVWCCEKVEPGCINALSALTAVQIADRLIHMAGTTAHTPDGLELRAAAATFRALAKITRNGLIHSNPGSDPNGAQRLFRNGTHLDDLVNERRGRRIHRVQLAPQCAIAWVPIVKSNG